MFLKQKKLEKRISILVTKHPGNKKALMINFLKKEQISQKPFLLFLPFLLFYIVIIIIFHSPVLIGDEFRYVYFANNLINGFYSPAPPNINLWNGPGYPMFLVPFLLLKINPLYIVLTNALLYYLSVVLLFKSLQKIASFKLAFAGAAFWALYYNSYQDMMLMCTEVLTSFLIILFFWLLLKIFDISADHKRKHILFAGFIFGYLILTKIIFAYVLLALLAGSFVLYIINRRNQYLKKTFFILLISLVVIAPYLIYTYNLTGRIYYLGNSGGMSLYWMSSPNLGEYGDWFNESGKTEKAGNTLPEYEAVLKANHQQDYDEIFKYEGVERDDAYKRLAIRNIKAKPLKFLENFVSNIGRLLFSYPYSYTLQTNKSLLRLPLTGTLFVLMVLCLIPTIKNWRKLIFPLKLILIFLLVYLGLSTVVSAYTRMFSVIVPLLLFWIIFIIERCIKIQWQFDNPKSSTIST